MVHKLEELKRKEIATQEDIDALKEKLKILELEQKRQRLEADVKEKKFWTEHKKLRGSVKGVQKSVSDTHKFLRKKVAPAILGGIRETVEFYKKEKEKDVKELQKQKAFEKKYSKI